ncbi:MAG: SGNH/GDSL hydrolase family protein [Lachnospiraceae bacterium]|nr:SGNH/GDSL hydrolase family protein [Lachnospiraceae bacterium]
MMLQALFTERSELRINMRAREWIKKTVSVVFKIILTVFLVITLNRIFLPKYVNENQDGRITQEYYRYAKDTDVIFAGSSTVHSGIDPRVLFDEQGISAYLRANASQTMWISYYMIEDAIRCHKPELVCIDMTFIKYGDDFVEEPSTRKALDGMRMSLSKINCIKASMGEDEKMADYIMPLFRFHSRWKELTLDDFRYAYYNKPVTVKGYLPDDEVESAEEGELVYTREGDTSISPKNIYYLRKAIELCEKNGIQVMLFKVPAHSSNWSRDYDEQISAIAAEYGVSYINFDDLNDDIGLDYSTDTPDGGSHLNANGAVKFSSYLGDCIKKDYKVSDRRR